MLPFMDSLSMSTDNNNGDPCLAVNVRQDATSGLALRQGNKGFPVDEFSTVLYLGYRHIQLEAERMACFRLLVLNRTSD
jgi:hypothetical protein